jgi:DNA (cytosine-5)-methyltransferase 1
MKQITYIDLFAGCGGLSYGFYEDPQFKCLFASDIWKEAKKNYDFNHLDIPFEIKDFSSEVDVTEIIKKFGGKCDIVLGGPPCQGFSTLGKREVDCKKSVLVDSFIDAAIAIKPKFILMENVKAIRSKKHPEGGTFIEKIDEKLINANYVYKTVVLNALDFGLGQTRQRFFLFATKKEYSYLLDEFMICLDSEKAMKHTTLKELISDLPKIEAGEEWDSTKPPHIYNHKAMNHSSKLVERFKHVPEGGGLLDVPKDLLTNHLKKMVDGEYGSGGHVKSIYGRMDWDRPSGTIVAGMDKITIGRFLHPVSDRLLTPRECARIQSFPDDFIFSGGMVTQYYLIGNAVPPLFSRVFAKSYLQTFKEDKWI